MKRGQMQGEMFIYLTTLLVIGFLLFFGITWIKDLLEKQKIIEMTKFKNNLEQRFEDITFDSSRVIQIDVPSDAQRACFLNTKDVFNYGIYNLCIAGSEQYDSLICNAWEDRSISIMLSPPLLMEVNIGNITVKDARGTSEGYLCFNTAKNRKIRFEIKGKGSYVEVKALA